MKLKRIGIIGACILLASSWAAADTLGLVYIDTAEVFEGYTLFAPISYTTTYLIDIYGRLVHSWDSAFEPGQSAYLLENGHLLRTAKAGFVSPTFAGGGIGGRIQEFDWDGTLLWNYVFSSPTYCQHHDIEYLPNGNILIVAWELKSIAEAVAAGRSPTLIPDGELWPDMIVEIDPIGPDDGEIVWAWHSWDHLIQDFDSTKDNYGIIAENPGKLDINFVQGPGGADWLHINSVDYNPDLDQIVVSAHNTHELYVIDHSTADYDSPAVGIAAAAGPAGDILYRWGNPRVYDRGIIPDQEFFGQHDVQWIEPGLPGEGDILIFNNGINRRPPPNYSSVETIEPPVDSLGNYYIAPGAAFGPSTQSWIYTSDPETLFYSSNISGAQRLLNGNTLVCSGASGRFFEINPAGDIVWEYVNPVNHTGPQYQGTDITQNQVFRCYRYAADYPGLIGRDLTPGNPIELYHPGVVEETDLPIRITIEAYPNPFNSTVNLFIRGVGAAYPPQAQIGIQIFDISGRLVADLPLPPGANGNISNEKAIGAEPGWPTPIIWQPDKSLGSGIYHVRANFTGANSITERVVYLK